MPKKPRILFTIADNNPVNQTLLKGFINSLRKFHSEEELPVKVIGQEQLDKINDQQKFYRMTPLIARTLIQEYDTVIKADCDQIVTGKLNHLWESYKDDVKYVLNGNPREPAYSVLDIHPAEYANCGLVVMNSASFVRQWWKLCYSLHFNSYQFREQDLLNIMTQYGDYSSSCLDHSDKWHGLVGKGFYAGCYLKNDKVMMPKTEFAPNLFWPMDEDKEIKLVHFAGGQDPNKGNYRSWFQPEVAKYLDYLISDGEAKTT